MAPQVAKRQDQIDISNLCVKKARFPVQNRLKGQLVALSLRLGTVLPHLVTYLEEPWLGGP